MSKAKNTYFALRSFARYMLQHKFSLLIVAFLFIVANVALALIPIFIGKLVGALASNPVNKDLGTFYVVLLIVCSIGHDLFWRIAEYAYLKLVNPLSYRYEALVFKEVINNSYPYFVDKFTGKISAYISNLGQELRSLNDSIFYNYVSQVVNIAGIIIILSTINKQTGLIFICGLALMFIVGRVTIRNSVKFEKRAADIASTKNGKVIDIISNFVNVKAFGKEQKETEHITAEQKNNEDAADKSFWWSMMFWASMSFIVRELMWPITIVLNFKLFLSGGINIQQLTTLLATVLLFSTTIWEIVWHLSQFNLKQARSEEAHTYLFGKRVIILRTGKILNQTVPTFEEKIQLNNLTFAYPDKKDSLVISGVTLEIRKGEKIGIVGRSGSGKTTITKVLLGYYEIENAVLSVDGQNVSSKQLGSLISYVPQDTTLFHRTIAENISYASDGPVTEEQIIEASKRAHAHEFIENIDYGYRALVGERGVKLSAGQRQRIAIARAYLDNKPILVLDEATSALDSESEVLVQKALEELWKEKTVIAIAHRLSTLRNMDRIILISNGRISEQGTHDELLLRKGAYARLWSHQSGGFLSE